MTIDFAKGAGLVPAIIQDARTGVVLMLGYMNEAALAKTKETGLVTFYSRSKKRLWQKGESSGNTLAFVDCLSDCDNDSLLIKAVPNGPTCHTGAASCFADDNSEQFSFLFDLETIIKDRVKNPVEGSYTASLLKQGKKKIAQKVGEEGVEVALEGVAGEIDLLKEESADLLYHLLVLLNVSGISFAEVLTLLRDRNSSR